MAAQPAILQMLSGAASNPQTGLAQIKETVAKLRALKDPKAGMQMLMQQRNPGMAQAIDYIKQHGNDPRAAFEALARERGLDPAEIAKQIGL